jgi:hypothetical protein
MRGKGWLGVVLVVLLGLGLAGCGGDDGGDEDSGDDDGPSLDSSDDTEPTTTTTEPVTTTTKPPVTTTAPATTEGPTGNVSGAIEAYCAAVDEYVQQLQDILADPSGDTAALIETANELAEQAGQLQPTTPEDAERILACTDRAADALTPAG